MTAPSNDDSTSTSRRSLGIVFKLLADAQRRALLQFFIVQNTDVAELAELVEYIQKNVDEIATARQARIALTHNHLPKLAEYDVIEYDQRSQTVRYWGETHLEALLMVAGRLEATT